MAGDDLSGPRWMVGLLLVGPWARVSVAAPYGSVGRTPGFFAHFFPGFSSWFLLPADPGSQGFCREWVANIGVVAG